MPGPPRASCPERCDERPDDAAHPGRADPYATGSAGADLRVRVPGRDHADHRRRVRHDAGPGVRLHQPCAPVRGVLPHPGDRRDRPGHGAGAAGVLPRARLLAVAAPVYGLPAMHAAWRVLLALTLGAVCFTCIGVLLGSVLPSARSAQAVGLVLFFPSFLLGAGGPPPHVMGAAVRTVAGPLPLTLLTNAVREPWLGIGTATSSLVALAGLTVLVAAVAARRAVL